MVREGFLRYLSCDRPNLGRGYGFRSRSQVVRGGFFVPFLGLGLFFSPFRRGGYRYHGGGRSYRGRSKDIYQAFPFCLFSVRLVQGVVVVQVATLLIVPKCYLYGAFLYLFFSNRLLVLFQFFLLLFRFLLQCLGMRKSQFFSIGKCRGFLLV